MPWSPGDIARVEIETQESYRVSILKDDYERAILEKYEGKLCTVRFVYTGGMAGIVKVEFADGNKGHLLSRDLVKP